MARGFGSNYRIVLLVATVLAAFGGIGARLVHLHVIDRERLVTFVDKVRRQIVVEPARRGDILDGRGKFLATSRSLISLGVDPQVLRPEDEPKWPELARLIGLPLRELETIFRTKTRPVAPVATSTTGGLVIDLDGDEPSENTPTERKIQWAKLADSVEESVYEQIVRLDIKGVYAPPRVYTRAYPNNELAAHVVGYVNKEGVAVQGVERWADFYLRGQDGWRESEKDGKRQELAQFRAREVAPSRGYDVMLSIDSVIQHRVEAELSRIMTTFSPTKATIIVSDARTGFILGLANAPTFNLNAYGTVSGDDMNRMRNVAVADVLEPGSTFKIVAASGALQEGLVQPSDTFDCTLERIEYKGRSRDLPREDHHFHHPLTVTEIISRSSNKGAAQLGMLLQEKRLYEYAKAFGFGEYTGFSSIYPESPGIFAHYSKWSGSDITRIPMGHTVAATPLQIHFAMGVIASGGELLRPQIVKEIRNEQGEALYRFGKVVRRRVISQATAKTVAGMLSRVTVAGEGTAAEAAIPGYEIAAKTGTSQKIVDGKYSSQHHIASFVGFFPASRPEVVISVIVDDGRSPAGGTGYGGVVAAPGFKRIAEHLIQYLDIKPTGPVPGRPLFALEGVRP
ncbi:MAG TPA: penicillin-binding protein 2 [Opitutaceae bacterium]|jgi:cell division protein FtsI (penicillin-binding protein 3)|nr:penicillin-binding protein 2 [Opitutaceae bacterium]HRE04502.1 penicillin-binding protein 2 [Opitutaceae bacterium]